jgi:hypothetical protein
MLGYHRPQSRRIAISTLQIGAPSGGSAATEIKRVIRKRVHVETAAAAKHPARSRGRVLRKQFSPHPRRVRSRDASACPLRNALARASSCFENIFLTILSLVPLTYLPLVMRDVYAVAVSVRSQARVARAWGCGLQILRPVRSPTAIKLRMITNLPSRIF